jgi:hypothetical protein
VSSFQYQKQELFEIFKKLFENLEKLMVLIDVPVLGDLLF